MYRNDVVFVEHLREVSRRAGDGLPQGVRNALREAACRIEKLSKDLGSAQARTEVLASLAVSHLAAYRTEDSRDGSCHISSTAKYRKDLLPSASSMGGKSLDEITEKMSWAFAYHLRDLLTGEDG